MCKSFWKISEDIQLWKRRCETQNIKIQRGGKSSSIVIHLDNPKLVYFSAQNLFELNNRSQLTKLFKMGAENAGAATSSLKVCLIGDAGVGKTSYLRKLLKLRSTDVSNMYVAKVWKASSATLPKLLKVNIVTLIYR